MTAEDAGAGVQAGTLVLTVRPEGAAPVPLPLHEAEPLIGDWSGQPAVEAGVPMSLEVSGLPPRAAVTVRMGGEVLAGDQYREEDCVHLELQDPLPFDNMIGVAKLEVLVSMGPQACSFFYAEPLRIILKPGLASDNLLRMSESVTSPRLYEYFSLVSLLGGLERRGWTSVEAKRHEYAGAGPLYADNAAAALLNTFIFRRKEDDGGNEEIVRLWYQPVLAAGNVEPENGIGLARTTRWSVRPLNAEAADTLRETDRAWYSPDFLISLESGGRTAWAVMDSKYSTVGTVLRHHAMQQAFKYLTSLGTVRKDDVYAGLWLYCGSVANDRTQEGSFFNASAPDVLPVPDMVLERVNALSEADPVAGVLERLRTVLAR